MLKSADLILLAVLACSRSIKPFNKMMVVTKIGRAKIKVPMTPTKAANKASGTVANLLHKGHSFFSTLTPT